jgi:hypothetical protein
MELVEKELTQRVIGTAKEVHGVPAPPHLDPLPQMTAASRGLGSPASGEKEKFPSPFSGERVRVRVEPLT